MCSGIPDSNGWAASGFLLEQSAMKIVIQTGIAVAIAICALTGGAPLRAVMQNTDQMAQQVSALRRMMESVGRGDAATYAQLYSPDAVITIHGGGQIRGRDAIAEYEAGLMREFPGTRLAFYAVWQRAPLAVVHYGVNGRTPDGRPMGHEGLLFFRFHASGTIDEERRYLDSLTPMAQLGALGAVRARPLPTLPADMTAHAGTDSAEERRNVALVRASLAAMESKDAAAFFSRVSDDVTIDELMLPGPFIGKENAKRWFDAWVGAVPNLQVEVTTALGVGDVVLAETVMRGTLVGPFAGLGASAKPFAVHRSIAVRVKDGLLVHLAGFMNGKELAEETGQWPRR